MALPIDHYENFAARYDCPDSRDFYGMVARELVKMVKSQWSVVCGQKSEKGGNSLIPSFSKGPEIATSVTPPRNDGGIFQVCSQLSGISRQLSEIKDDIEQPSRLTPHPSINILDVGCGSGYSTEALAEEFREGITAIDPSGEMLKLAQSKDCLAQVDFLPLAASELPQLEKRYQLVFSSFSAHWFPEDLAKIAEMNAERGMLALAFPLRGGSGELNAIVRKVFRSLRGRPQTQSDRVMSSRLDDLGYHWQQQVLTLEERGPLNAMADMLKTRGVLLALFGEKEAEAYEMLRSCHEKVLSWQWRVLLSVGRKEVNWQ